MSCNTAYKSVENRMKVHAIELKQINIDHKIRLDGVYYVGFNNTVGFSNKKGFYKDTTYEFHFYRFFENGKVYNSKIFNKVPTEAELRDTSILPVNVNWGNWRIYFVRQSTLYVESYNGYRGYYLDQAIIDDNKITFLSEKKIEKETVKVPISTLKFMEFKNK